MATQADHGIPLSTLAPKFLHTNSTSHTWPFSAIAELIDNAYDPDVSAKQFWIDKTVIKGEACLTFMDNGNGLNNESMHKMLSFGYSDKIAVNGQEPIGIYGNGFKSGSMRLGRDAIVFSKSKEALCVGMLSQTYLEKIDAKQIVVPIVCFDQKGPDMLFLPEHHKASLQAILQYSPFNTQEELYSELSTITSCSSAGKTGTRIIIWNLRRTSAGGLEFDFEKDRYDIQIPSEFNETINGGASHSDRAASQTPETQYSLRAYCSVLYLKPRMQIMVRGVKVKSQLIKKSLACIRKDHYKPQSLLGRRISIIFGFNTKSTEQYGFMMYHKNRLIKAYERVGCQLKADNRGVGVIGVIECNFLEPTHNKQNFLESDKYRKAITSLGIKLEEYWHEMHFEMKKENPNSTVPMEDTMKRPDQNWVQCDGCLRWRKLPDGIDCSKLPDKWFCRMNPDPQFRTCQVEEEPEDSDDDQPSYRKTFREQEREKKRKLQIQRASCSTSSTPNTSPRPEVSPQVVKLPKAACTPADNNGLPIITNVCSLSATPQSAKRHRPVKPLTLKRRKLNSGNSGSVDSPGSLGSASPLAVPIISDGDETDDDLVILETASTPKPPRAGIDMTKVKTEKENESISLLLEGNAAAVADSSETSVAAASSAGCTAGGAIPSPEPAPHVSSTTTQTDAPKVKLEESSQQDEARKEGTMPNAHDHNSGLDASNVEEKGLKQESHGDSLGDNHRDVPMQNGVTHELESDVYTERDALKLQVQELTCKLQEMQEQMGANVKKELSHQLTQTDETEGYRRLPEEVKQESKQEEDAAKQHEERDSEVALQAEQLIQEVDEINKRKDMLLSQVESLKKEKEDIAAQCEELVLRLQEQKEKEPTGSATVVSSDQPPSDGEEPSTSSAAVSSEDAFKSLVELRHNIGRVLVHVVPALDLGQVNYQCNVIDEMLDNIVNNQESFLGLVDQLNAHI